MFDLIIAKYAVSLLVLTRMSAMILFNPLFGRKSIPTIIKVGLALLISIIVVPTISANPQFRGLPDFLFACLKELLIGFAGSFVMQLFLSTIMVAGEIIDLQLGVSMSKVYDPQSNVSMPISGSVFNVLFTLLFFAANGHLTFIKIMALSFRVLPPGLEIISFDFSQYIVQLFGSVLIMAVKLALPVIAVELVTEIGLGILMRTVPQINTFAVGMQLKLFIGLILLVLILPNVANLFDSLMNSMFENIEHSLKLIT